MKTIILMILLMTATISNAMDSGKSWNFDHDRPDAIPGGFYIAAGSWRVRPDATASSKPNILAQLAKNSRDTFNLALLAGSIYRDIDISVKMRPIAGAVEQGGGIVWRAKDSINYYAVSYSPLAGTLRLLKVVNNGQVELANIAIMSSPGWHTLRVVMTDNHITCYFDGTKYVDRNDDSYPQAGRVGLWTKADAQTYFDDLIVTAK